MLVTVFFFVFDLLHLPIEFLALLSGTAALLVSSRFHRYAKSFIISRLAFVDFFAGTFCSGWRILERWER